MNHWILSLAVLVISPMGLISCSLQDLGEGFLNPKITSLGLSDIPAADIGIQNHNQMFFNMANAAGVQPSNCNNTFEDLALSLVPNNDMRLYVDQQQKSTLLLAGCFAEEITEGGGSATTVLPGFDINTDIDNVTQEQILSIAIMLVDRVMGPQTEYMPSKTLLIQKTVELMNDLKDQDDQSNGNTTDRMVEGAFMALAASLPAGTLQ